MANDYIQEITKVFTAQGNAERAAGAKAYLRHQFDFVGLTTPQRRKLAFAYIKEKGFPPEDEFEDTLLALYALPEREYQYFAIEVLVKYRKQWPPHLWKLLEKLITQKSWWDTVDYIATGVAGPFFKQHPELIHPVTRRWMKSDNIWLQRVCLLFQLLYKKDTDAKLLFGFIEKLKESNEFFIQKAIGWALRQYAYTDAETVRSFVHNTTLKPLSRREALKHIGM